MHVNRIQLKIFIQLSQKHDLTVDEYINAFSDKFICKHVSCLDELTEEDGDTWITQAYLQSI